MNTIATCGCSCGKKQQIITGVLCTPAHVRACITYPGRRPPRAGGGIYGQARGSPEVRVETSAERLEFLGHRAWLALRAQGNVAGLESPLPILGGTVSRTE